MQVKAALRKQLIAKRRTLAGKSEKDSAIFDKLIRLPEFAGIDLVLTYVSTSIEVDTLRLIEHCFAHGIAVAVPAIIDEEMRFFRIANLREIGDMVTVFDNSLCIVPGLAFDKSNRRLGYGGGYYDRFLRDYRGYKLGICYSEFIIDIPTEEHDEKVDKVIWI
jgi:5-formyltetrahydrofolate cyclo-ligase